MHRLTYIGVTGAEFWGLSPEPKDYLRANVTKGGTLIVQGEVPYLATQVHERHAVDALAKLAGLDLHLIPMELRPHDTRLMFHVQNCGHSIILA